MARPAAITPVSLEKNFIRFALYGEPGVGKTAVVGTSPKCLILAHDRDEVVSAALNSSKADVWVTDDFDEMQQALDWVRHEGVREYEWVWIDNLTLFQEQVMDETMKNLVAARPHRDFFIPDKAEYLQVQQRISWLIREFKSLPMHFGFTAHVMLSENIDEETVALPLLQGGQGALSQKVCGYMNVVGYMTAEKEKTGTIRKIYLEKHKKYTAKDRFSTTKSGTLVVASPPNTIPHFVKLAQQRVPTLGTMEKPRVVGGSRRASASKALPAVRRAGTIRKAAAVAKKKG